MGWMIGALVVHLLLAWLALRKMGGTDKWTATQKRFNAVFLWIIPILGPLLVLFTAVASSARYDDPNMQGGAELLDHDVLD